jgi:hypothetical protein
MQPSDKHDQTGTFLLLVCLEHWTSKSGGINTLGRLRKQAFLRCRWVWTVSIPGRKHDQTVFLRANGSRTVDDPRSPHCCWTLTSSADMRSCSPAQLGKNGTLVKIYADRGSAGHTCSPCHHHRSRGQRPPPLLTAFFTP